MGLIYMIYIPCEGSATIPNHVDDSRNQVESLHGKLYVILESEIKISLLFLQSLVHVRKMRGKMSAHDT